MQLVLATLRDTAAGEGLALGDEFTREARQGRSSRRERIVEAGMHLVLALHDVPDRESEASAGRLPKAGLLLENALISEFYSKHRRSKFLASDLWFSVATRFEEGGRTDVAFGLLGFLARFPNPEREEMNMYRSFISRSHSSDH